MSFNECVNKKIIFKTEIDKERSQSLEKIALLRLEFIQTINESKYLFKKIEEYYEVIKELILANMYLKGYNCTNHICLIAYLKEFYEGFEFEIHKIDELRKIRNEINYRGFKINQDYLNRNELEFKNIITKLIQTLKYLNK